MKTIEKKNQVSKQFNQFGNLVIDLNQQMEVKGGTIGTDDLIMQ